jgi:acyl phosphate:glycerol-3-phosphate acyltransferase
MTSALPVALIVATYLIGSIPFSFLVPFLMTGKDIRKHGSRNVGATNVARTFGKAPGIVALLLDIAKGFAAVEVARWFVMRSDWPLVAHSISSPFYESRELWIALGALIAVLAHMFPVWLRFHDAKVVLAGIIVFIIVILVTRIVSLASIISSASIPLFFHFLADAPFWRVAISILISIAIIAKHHSNIARLVHGEERRMGERK